MDIAATKPSGCLHERQAISSKNSKYFDWAMVKANSLTHKKELRAPKDYQVWVNIIDAYSKTAFVKC